MSELYLALGNNSVPFNLWVEVMIRLLKILDVTIYQVIDMPVKKLKNVLYVEPGKITSLFIDTHRWLGGGHKSCRSPMGKF